MGAEGVAVAEAVAAEEVGVEVVGAHQAEAGAPPADAGASDAPQVGEAADEGAARGCDGHMAIATRPSTIMWLSASSTALYTGLAVLMILVR